MPDGRTPISPLSAESRTPGALIRRPWAQPRSVTPMDPANAGRDGWPGPIAGVARTDTAPDPRFVSLPVPGSSQADGTSRVDGLAPILQRAQDYPAASGTASVYIPRVESPTPRPAPDAPAIEPETSPRKTRERLRRDTVIVIFALGLAITVFSLLIWRQQTAAHPQPSSPAATLPVVVHATSTATTSPSARTSAPPGTTPPASATPLPTATPSAPIPSGAPVAPVAVSAFTTCVGVSPDSRELIVQGGDLDNGTITTDVGTVLVSRYDGLVFDFEASPPAQAVLVQAGDTQNLYRYDPARASDHGLVGPRDRGDGGPIAISRIALCLSPAAAATPSQPAEPSATSTPTSSPSPSTPEVVGADLECAGIKVAWRSLSLSGETLADGIITDGHRGARVADFTGTSFSFEAPAPFEAAIVAGSASANLYRFVPPAVSRTQLTAPATAQIVQISFCYSPD